MPIPTSSPKIGSGFWPEAEIGICQSYLNKPWKVHSVAVTWQWIMWPSLLKYFVYIDKICLLSQRDIYLDQVTLTLVKEVALD